MQSLYLMGEKVVETCNKEVITIKYCLVEEREVRARPLYGIQIIQTRNSNHAISEYTEPLSHSKRYVNNILNKLIANNVLASSLLETVDDLII